MKKIEEVIRSVPNVPSGYSTMDVPTESYIWEEIQQLLPRSSKYIKHFVNQTWEFDPHLPTYQPSCNKSLNIEVGTLIFTLVIYYE